MHTITLQMDDRSIKYPLGVLQDVPVRVGKFYILVDFVVLDMDEGAQISIILGRPFLCTAGAIIDVKSGSLTLTVGDDKVIFKLTNAIKAPMLEQSCCKADILDEVGVEKVQNAPKAASQSRGIIKNNWRRKMLDEGATPCQAPPI